MKTSRLSKRLARLEVSLGLESPPRRPCDVLCLDHNGKILCNHDEATQPWAGLPASEWPEEWWDQPWPLKVVLGVDPLEVLGRKEGSP